jgi:two-component system chemotaxis response regulator CheY
MNSKLAILCVDDERIILDSLKAQIEKKIGYDYLFEYAESPEEALEIIDDLIVDEIELILVISDYQMPGMKGDKFLEEIHKKLPDTIKILLTGQAGLDSAIRAINYGGLNRYVEKPWNIDLLSRDIQDLITKFRQNLENQHMLRELNKKIQELEFENNSLKKSS